MEIVDLICRRANGIQPLRQVSAIKDGWQKNRCQIWRLGVDRAFDFHRVGLIHFDHRPGQRGAYGRRTKSFVSATALGREWVERCREAARQSNLSWPGEYDGYLTFQAEWLQRRDAFRRALTELASRLP